MQHGYQILIAFPSPDSGQRNDETLGILERSPLKLKNVDPTVEDNLRSLTTY